MNQFPRPLRASFWDVAFYSLMVGLGETYITAFALALGFSEQNSGMMATFPILIASFVQIWAGTGVRWLGSQRRWVLLCACGQALALLGLSVIGFIHPAYSEQLVAILFVCVTIYWSSALSASPSWNSWIASIVPDPLRTPFFAIRARIAQFCTVLGLVTTGFWLQQIHDNANRSLVFGMVFAVSGMCRLISAYFLSRHPDTICEFKMRGLHRIFGRDGFAWLCERRTGVIVLFMLSTHFAVHISGPYFNAYMLRHLKLDYFDYMILISASFVARVLTGGWLQRFAIHYGATSLTHVGSFLVIFTPVLWVFSDAFAYMFLLQIFTGIAWGCHELGVTLMLMEKQSHDERARLLTLTNLLNSSAMFLGSSFGYWLLAHEVLEAQHYYRIFTVSTVLRTLPFLVLTILGDSRLRPTQWIRQLFYGGRRIFRSS